MVSGVDVKKAGKFNLCQMALFCEEQYNKTDIPAIPTNCDTIRGDLVWMSVFTNFPVSSSDWNRSKWVLCVSSLSDPMTTLAADPPVRIVSIRLPVISS